jgi:hypothetical protein
MRAAMQAAHRSASLLRNLATATTLHESLVDNAIRHNRVEISRRPSGP